MLRMFAAVWLMDAILTGYSVSSETWFCLSLLLIVSVFFKFGRLWSLRNLDLLLLLLIAPGLLLVEGKTHETAGYVWLFVLSGVLLIRVLLDVYLTRRPRLEQNLNTSGLSFLCVAAFAFHTTNIMNADPASLQSVVNSMHRGADIYERKDAEQPDEQRDAGPGFDLASLPAAAAAQAVSGGGAEVYVARMMAILAHLAVCLGLIMFARTHFGHWEIGLAMTMLYLLLPATSYDVQRVNHVLPAAFIIWALVAFRRPLVSGSLLGLACGTLIFPVFLLPLWAAFYGRKGIVPFGSALIVVAAVLLGTILMTSADSVSFVAESQAQFRQSIGYLLSEEPDGFWQGFEPAYRMPVVATYLLMVLAFAIWPRKQTLGVLVAHSAAVVIGAQFWYTEQGGTYVLWYVPLLLMIMFRPPLLNQQSQVELDASQDSKEEGNGRPELASMGGRVSGAQFYR